MENINLRISLLVLAVLIVSASGVFAGISSPYWGGSNPNPLKMYPGETKDVYFNLQNCPSLADSCSKTDDNLVVSLLEGSEIAQITSGDKYTVPYGTADSNVVLKVTIPENAAIGTAYNVKFSVSTVSAGTGTVQLGVGYNVDFPVEVVSKVVAPAPVPSETPLIEQPAAVGLSSEAIAVIIIAIIAVIVIVIWLIYWLSKKKGQEG